MFIHLSTPPRARLLQTQIIFQSTLQVNFSKPKSFFHLPTCSKPKSFYHLPTWSIAPNPNHSSICPPDQSLQTQIILPSTHQINFSEPKSFFHLPTCSKPKSFYPPDQLLQTQIILPYTHQINRSKPKSFFHLPTRQLLQNQIILPFTHQISCSKLKSFFHLLTIGLVRTLEILENPGKFLKPWKPRKSPGIFLWSPGKSHRTLLKK